MAKYSRRTQETLKLGLSALKTGEFETARKALLMAAKYEKRDPAIRMDLATALRRTGDVEGAARELTEALAIKPAFEDAARRLSALLQRFEISYPEELNAFGLRAALLQDTADPQPIARVAFSHVCRRDDVSTLLEYVFEGRAEEAARLCFTKAYAPLLRDDLLNEALRRGKNTSPDVETLLTAIRSHLVVNVSAEDALADRGMFSFALSLIAQCRNNDYVWPVSEDERAAIAPFIEASKQLWADATESPTKSPWALILALLYRPFEALAPDTVTPEAAGAIRPKALGALLAEWTSERVDLAAGRDSIACIATIEDATSVRVAGQYEQNPYPRWVALPYLTPEAHRQNLTRIFGGPHPAILDQTPSVLVAGCGTGYQAAIAAQGYGPGSHVTAIDISRASLAYAQRQCARRGFANIEFFQADILEIAQLDRAFDVIECVGVLHHMADPFEGWRRLLACLKPGGLMQIGLYSAISRQNISALRSAPGYPGSGCTDMEARAYRAELLARPPESPAHRLRLSQDFYSLNEFRDLVLHENEHHLRLPEIESFLQSNGLRFCGFALDPSELDRFTKAHPEQELPGDLTVWDTYEAAHPTVFDGMYVFWCEKPA